MPEQESRWYSRRRLSPEGEQTADAANRFLLESGTRRIDEPAADPVRVVIDTCVLVGASRKPVVAAAALGFYRGYWSSWIVAEFMRVWLELAALNIGPSAKSSGDASLRLRLAWERAKAVVDHLLEIFVSVDYRGAPEIDLSWLRDRDDVAVMRTALAAEAQVLVTENSKDFPLGETRCGVLFLSASQFLEYLYQSYPDAAAEVAEYLRGRGRA